MTAAEAPTLRSSISSWFAEDSTSATKSAHAIDFQPLSFDFIVSLGKRSTFCDGLLSPPTKKVCLETFEYSPSLSEIPPLSVEHQTSGATEKSLVKDNQALTFGKIFCPITNSDTSQSDTTSLSSNGSFSSPITTTVSFSKRGNGNQPWKDCCATPSAIGKMRRLCFNLSTSSPVSHKYQLSVRVKPIDPENHKGKLTVIGKGLKRTQIFDDKGSNMVTLPEIDISSSSSSSSSCASLEIFLRPQWGGLGLDKTKPNFNIMVDLLDCATGFTTEILTWKTEIQSHKFESSRRGKAMDANAKATISVETNFV